MRDMTVTGRILVVILLPFLQLTVLTNLERRQTFERSSELIAEDSITI
jgi:hypothetical protein